MTDLANVQKIEKLEAKIEALAEKAASCAKIALIARNLRVPGGSDEVQRATIARTLGL